MNIKQKSLGFPSFFYVILIISLSVNLNFDNKLEKFATFIYNIFDLKTLFFFPYKNSFSSGWNELLCLPENWWVSVTFNFLILQSVKTMNWSFFLKKNEQLQLSQTGSQPGNTMKFIFAIKEIYSVSWHQKSCWPVLFLNSKS